MNIVLIVSDTLRRDHVPGYATKQVIAPNLGAFAKTAQIFEQPYAASFPTVSARADLMTGRYTFTYLDWGPLPHDEITLPQSLRRAGYATFGVADTPFFIRNGYGYDRGFDDFIWIRGQRDGPEREDVLSQRRAEEDYFAPMTFRTAINWLERHHRERFFLYVDTWDPHEPWDPPDYYVRPYYPDYANEQIGPCYWDWREDGYSEKDVAIAYACYRGEITMVDRWFGMLLRRLESLGRLEDTAVIFASDHGFYFGEYGMLGKRRFRWPGNVPFIEGFRRGLSNGKTYRSPLHNEVTQVPLLIYLPGAAPQRIPALVSLPDLMPTVLDLAGAAIPERVQAESLLPLIRGERQSLHEFVVTSAPLEAVGTVSQTVDDRERQVVEISPSTVTDGEWDLLYAAAGEPVELYRAQDDPGHTTNVYHQNRPAAEELHRKFVAWLEATGTPPALLEPRRSL